MPISVMNVLPVTLEQIHPGEGPGAAIALRSGQDRLLAGVGDQQVTVSKESVDELWMGKYLVAWPQAPDWPVEIGIWADGPAVETVMDMASRVSMPYHGERVFDRAFQDWLKDFQARNGLQADGIVGRNTLLHLMTASIEEPRLLESWE